MPGELNIIRLIDDLRDNYALFRIPGNLFVRLINNIFDRIIAGPNKGSSFSAPNGPAGYFWGNRCRTEAVILKEILSAGDVFYDIGAHVGYLSILAANLVGNEGKVISCEPHSGNFTALEKNISSNNLLNVIPINCALSDKSGDGFIQSKADSTRYAVSESRTGEKVQMFALDELISRKNLPKPSFVKIDVERAEIKVLEGMYKTIESVRPNILIEVHRLGADFNTYISKLASEFELELNRIDGKPLTNNPEKFLLMINPK